MGKPSTIYALVSGEYADYGVFALFADRNDAEANKNRYNETRRGSDPARVEEFDFYPPGSAGALFARERFIAVVWIDPGEIRGGNHVVSTHRNENEATGVKMEVIDFRRDSIYADFQVIVEADDAGEALREARARAQRMLQALDEGVDPMKVR